MNSVSRIIDHTLLRPDATESQIRQLCEEAVRFHFATVCVNPAWVTLCAETLRGAGVGVCTVAAFPLGCTPTAIKVAEARRGILDGACEVDMVIHIGMLKSGNYNAVLDDVRGVADAVHELQAKLKVILETPLLTEMEKAAACRIARQAAADFVKTATGFSAGGATVEDIALMRREVGDAIGVKASGGIRDLACARSMIGAGADRIGTSSGVRIALEEQQSDPA